MAINELHILEEFVRHGGELTPSEISEATGLPLVTVCRILKRLVQHGFLSRVAHGRYIQKSDRLRIFSQGHDLSRRLGNDQIEVVAMYPPPSPFYTGIKSVMESRHMRTVIHEIDGYKTREDDLEFLRNGSGILVYSANPLASFPGFFQYLTKTSQPVVSVGHATHEMCDTVSWDRFLSYSRLTRELLARGVRRIIYIIWKSVDEVDPEIANRRKGYEYAMQQSGLQPRVVYLPQNIFFKSEGREWLEGVHRETPAGEPVFLLFGHKYYWQGAGSLLSAQPDEQLRRRIRLCGPYVEGEDFHYRDIPNWGAAVHEPWEHLGRVSSARLISALERKVEGLPPEAPPLLTLVPPDIDFNPTALE